MTITTKKEKGKGRTRKEILMMIKALLIFLLLVVLTAPLTITVQREAGQRTATITATLPLRRAPPLAGRLYARE